MKNMPNNIIIETIAIGNSVKVTAIDTMSGHEGTIVGDTKAPKRQLEQLAIRKLEYVIKKAQK